MTIFAGIISSNATSLAEIKAELAEVFSKHINHNESLKFENNQQLFLGYNANNKQVASFSQEINSNLSWVSGKAILKKSEHFKADNEAEQLLPQWLDNNLLANLKQSRGVFSGVCLDDKKTTIFTDKLGIRPIYVYRYNDLVLYSSLMSILKDLSFIDLSLNDTNTAVYMGLGGCLGNTTPYKYINRVEAGEAITISVNNNQFLVTHETYWSYRTDIDFAKTTTDCDIKELYDLFDEAVALRSEPEQEAISFLSGGMDSRAITAMVNKHSVNQTTYNYSTENSQDQIFARDYAKNAGLIHNEQALKKFSNSNWSMLISESILHSDLAVKKQTYKPVWSGDGGSVCFGMVYITKKVAEALTENNFDQAIHHLISKFGAGMPHSCLEHDFSSTHESTIYDEIKKELIPFNNDPIKSAFFFLLYNDQKRHMDLHFETICQHGVELELPFFDACFLAKICSLPANDIMYHRAYSQWFELLPSYVRQTPWQTYPEHIACPIKSDKHLSYQWSCSKEPWHNKWADAKAVLKMSIKSPAFQFFNRTKLTLVLALHILNIKDYSYILRKVIKIDKLQ